MDMEDIDLGGGWHGSDPKPKSRQELMRERRLKEARETALVVDPGGSIVEVHVPPPINGVARERGYTVVVVANGQLQVAQWAASEGYTLFKDWCAEEPEKYDQYRKLMRARAEGLAVRMPNPDLLYPRKLLEHRERVQAGSTEGKVFVVGQGIIDDPETKARLDAKLRSMGVEPPVPAPSDPGPAAPEPKAGKKGSV